MDLFAIQCTTCGARLKVRSASAIGQIVACPKCQSMVHVAPPPGWQPPIPTPSPATPGEGRGEGSSRSLSSAGVLTADSDFRVGHSHAAASPPREQESLAPPLASPVERQGRRWTLAAISLAAVALVSIYGWSLLSSPPPAAADGAAAVAAASPEPPAAADPTPANEPAPPAPAESPSAEPTRPEPPPAQAKPSETKPSETKPVEPPPAPAAVAGTGTAPASAPASAPLPSVAVVPPTHSEAGSGKSLTVADRQTLARLEGRIAAIRFDEAKLADLVQFLSRMTAVTIEFDDQALIDAGIDDNQSVSVRLSATSAAKVLDAVLAECGLRYAIEAGRVRITVAEKPPPQP
jgi:hypothetical protein